MENSFLVLALPLTCASPGWGCLSEPPFWHLENKVTVKEIKHGSYQEVAIGLPEYGSQLPFVTLGMFLPMSASCL